ncbi:MAG: carboxyl transferase domain-containing protein [Myxococcota bacterium]
MSVLSTKLRSTSERFLRDREVQAQLLEEVRSLEAKVVALSERSRPKFEKRGQLLPRERLSRLLDPGSELLEISTLAGLGMHDDDGKGEPMGGGSVMGIGHVSGKRCLVTVTDSGIKGGAVAPMGLKKGLRGQEIALENRLPVVTLAESAGANLLYQAEMFVEGGRSFANQARLSAAGVPQVTVVHGSSTAGGAYLPGLSDYVVVVRGHSKIFLAGPPLLKAATGEIATDEALGGAELHAESVGTAEYMAEDDAHAVGLAREIMAHLRWDALELPSSQVSEPPLHDPEELLGIVPSDPKQPYEIREVIARIVDGSRFLDFKPQFGSHTVCGQAFLEGHPIGIIGNDGPIDPQGAVKAAQFIQLMSQSGTPLVFLMNTTGYLVGTEAESGGIVKHGSKMIQAVANAPVPKVTLVLGGSWGAGNYGMCGRGFSPRFIFSWPSARVGVMGPEQAATVMEIVTREKMEKRGMPVSEEFLQSMKEELIKNMEPQTTALYGTARLWDDGIIDPRDSRQVLALCLSVARTGEARSLRPNTFGVARG